MCEWHYLCGVASDDLAVAEDNLPGHLRRGQRVYWIGSDESFGADGVVIGSIIGKRSRTHVLVEFDEELYNTSIAYLSLDGKCKLYAHCSQLEALFLLRCYVRAHQGRIPCGELTKFFAEYPGIKYIIGKLSTFCETHQGLKYTAGSDGTQAIVTLEGDSLPAFFPDQVGRCFRTRNVIGRLARRRREGHGVSKRKQRKIGEVGWDVSIPNRVPTPKHLVVIEIGCGKRKRADVAELLRYKRNAFLQGAWAQPGDSIPQMNFGMTESLTFSRDATPHCEPKSSNATWELFCLDHALIDYMGECSAVTATQAEQTAAASRMHLPRSIWAAAATWSKPDFVWSASGGLRELEACNAEVVHVARQSVKRHGQSAGRALQTTATSRRHLPRSILVAPPLERKPVGVLPPLGNACELARVVDELGVVERESLPTLEISVGRQTLGAPGASGKVLQSEASCDESDDEPPCLEDASAEGDNQSVREHVFDDDESDDAYELSNMFDSLFGKNATPTPRSVHMGGRRRSIGKALRRAHVLLAMPQEMLSTSAESQQGAVMKQSRFSDHAVRAAFVQRWAW